MSGLPAWLLGAVLHVWVHDRASAFPLAAGPHPVEVRVDQSDASEAGHGLPPVPGRVVRRVHVEGNVAVLTFDACATRTQANGFDRPLYELLVKEQLPATVFVSGRWIETHPSE